MPASRTWILLWVPCRQLALWAIDLPPARRLTNSNLVDALHLEQIDDISLCKILAHNICCLIQSMFELNIKPEFWADETAF